MAKKSEYAEIVEFIDAKVKQYSEHLNEDEAVIAEITLPDGRQFYLTSLAKFNDNWVEATGRFVEKDTVGDEGTILLLKSDLRLITITTHRHLKSSPQNRVGYLAKGLHPSS